MKSLSFFAILFCAIGVFAQPKLTPHKITLKSGKTFNLNLPADYEIIPAAEGLKRVRFFAKAPDGRLFVTDMYNRADNNRGTIYILDGWNAKTGKFAKVIPYLTKLHNPNSVQFYTDEGGQDWIYIAETQQLTRRKYTAGEIRPTDTKPQVIATFPATGDSYKYGGWHLTRTIAFSPDRKLYVSVGSSCNACVEKTAGIEKFRATVFEMDPDGKNQREFSKGLRNAVSIKWLGGKLWASNQGSDHLGAQKPDETFYDLKSDADYGWPYCHSSGGKVFADPKITRASGCKNVTAPYAYFPAHASALGFDLFDDSDAPATIKDAFLVALHGATTTSGTIDTGNRSGYRIAIVREGQKLQDFMTGFLNKGVVLGRPCDIHKIDGNSFFVTDDHIGVIYYVRKKGHNT